VLWLEFGVVLAAIFVGARVGGTGLGTVAALGLAVLVFGFGLLPSIPPVTVLAIIIAVVTAASTMQAAGGMDLLVQLAEKALRAKPLYITFVGPVVAYVFTFCAGTGHVAYAILPVIAEVSRKAGVRPERPMSISVIASQQAITASPLSAATAGLLALLDPQGVSLAKILLICVPATFIGCLVGALAVSRRGVELADDPIYKERLAKGLVESPAPLPTLTGVARRNAIGSVCAFLVAALIVVAFGMFPDLRPAVIPAKDDPTTLTPLGMPQIIQITMYSAAGVMMLFFGAKADDTVRNKIAQAGVVAVISIVGLGWMGSCFFEGNQKEIVGALGDLVKAYPWIFALALFALSVLLFSQSATVAALMPVGISLGLPAGSLVAMFPAVNGYFLLPTYATIVAAVAFDRTGTTRTGRFLLDHSFMIPGLVATVVAILVGFALSLVVF
jgi:anaerobic C4-dicarboxylate transporter DcuA